MPESIIKKPIICNRNYCRNNNKNKNKNKILFPKKVVFCEEIIQENQLNETIKNDLHNLIKKMDIK